LALPAAYGPAYELRADKVEEVRDANSGRVLEYRTAVRLLRGGEEVAAEEVEVNGPLRYAGLGVYQSNMDVAGAGGLALETVKLAAGESVTGVGAVSFEWTLGEENGTVTTSPGEKVPLGDTGFELHFLDRYERFAVAEGQYRNDNPEYNPAAFVNVFSPSGAAAMGIIFELYPEFSVIKSSEKDFVGLPLTIKLEPAEPRSTGVSRDYVVVPETPFIVGTGERMSVALAAEASALGAAALTARLIRRDGVAETLTLPSGEWVPVTLADGDYAFRFEGVRRAPLTGLTVSRDPGLTAFYVGCLLLSLGVSVAMLLTYDELFVYVRDGKAYLTCRSSKGPRLVKDAFERWAKKIKEGL
jgi:hypothetical protein